MDPLIASRGKHSGRVALTPAAAELLVIYEIHGPLMFHQSGGCCDGTRRCATRTATSSLATRTCASAT